MNIHSSCSLIPGEKICMGFKTAESKSAVITVSTELVTSGVLKMHFLLQTDVRPKIAHVLQVGCHCTEKLLFIYQNRSFQTWLAV